MYFPDNRTGSAGTKVIYNCSKEHTLINFMKTNDSFQFIRYLFLFLFQMQINKWITSLTRMTNMFLIEIDNKINCLIIM